MHEVDGQYTARYPHLFDFFLGLGSITAQTTLLVPLKHGGAPNPEYGQVPIPPGVRIVGLPHWSSARMLVRRFHRVAPATVAIFARHLGSSDIIGAVAPSVVGTILITLARLRRRPVFLLVRGEKQRTVRWIMGERKARPYVAALKVMEAVVRHWIRAGVPTFVAGHELVERYAAPGARLYDLYPALSRDFPLASVPRDATADDPGRTYRLVTVARLSGEKGIDDLLRATALLREQDLAVQLEIVGDGPLRAELESLASHLGISDRVRFAGFVPHGPQLISALDESDLFVLPSRSEGLPHSVVEAMARALPVVATAVGGLPAFLRDGSGILVPIGDPEALAASLLEVLGDSQLRRRLSERALQTALRVHPLTQLVEFCAALADAYPQLLR
jgi:glycosyltransferase involved in cell wall biosynthesis